MRAIRSGVVPETPTGNAYDKYGTGNPIERRLMAGFFKALDRMLPEEPPSTVLEVGAGEGHVAARVRDRYPGVRVVTFDLPDPALTAAWEPGRGVFGSADRLPFAPASFDLVLAIEVLEHVPWPDRALAEIHRVARGPVVASVPREPLWRVLNLARGKYVRDLGNTPGHIQHWSRRGFAREVGAQLRVDELASPLPWTVLRASARSGGSAGS
jgi:SAM-dependent methyltransferase